MSRIVPRSPGRADRSRRDHGSGTGAGRSEPSEDRLAAAHPPECGDDDVEDYGQDKQHDDQTHDQDDPPAAVFRLVDSLLHFGSAKRNAIASVVFANDIPDLNVRQSQLGRSRDMGRWPQHATVLGADRPEGIERPTAALTRRPLPAQVWGEGRAATVWTIGPVVDDANGTHGGIVGKPTVPCQPSLLSATLARE